MTIRIVACRVGAATILAAGVVMTARQWRITGEFVRVHCDPASADWEKQDQWVCGSYVRGTLDGIRTLAFLAMGSYEAHVKAMPFCIPVGAELDTTIDVVMLHIETHPESRAQVGALAISDALYAKWPCPR